MAVVSPECFFYPLLAFGVLVTSSMSQAPQVAPFKASRAARSAAAAHLDKPRASNQQVPAKRARASTPACSTDVEADKMWLQSSGAQAAAKKPEAKAPRPLQLLLQEDKGPYPDPCLLEPYRLVSQSMTTQHIVSTMSLPGDCMGLLGADPIPGLCLRASLRAGLLAAAERIIAGRKLHDAAKDDVHAAYRVWRNRNPKRYPDKRVCGAVHAACTMHEILCRCHVTCVKPCTMPACHHALDWLLPAGLAAKMSSSSGTER